MKKSGAKTISHVFCYKMLHTAIFLLGRFFYGSHGLANYERRLRNNTLSQSNIKEIIVLRIMLQTNANNLLCLIFLQSKKQFVLSRCNSTRITRFTMKNNLKSTRPPFFRCQKNTFCTDVCTWVI